jgi:hypothetical protein
LGASGLVALAGAEVVGIAETEGVAVVGNLVAPADTAVVAVEVVCTAVELAVVLGTVAAAGSSATAEALFSRVGQPFAGYWASLG